MALMNGHGLPVEIWQATEGRVLVCCLLKDSTRPMEFT